MVTGRPFGGRGVGGARGASGRGRATAKERSWGSAVAPPRTHRPAPNRARRAGKRARARRLARAALPARAPHLQPAVDVEGVAEPVVRAAPGRGQEDGVRGEARGDGEEVWGFGGLAVLGFGRAPDPRGRAAARAAEELGAAVGAEERLSRPIDCRPGLACERVGGTARSGVRPHATARKGTRRDATLHGRKHLCAALHDQTPRTHGAAPPTSADKLDFVLHAVERGVVARHRQAGGANLDGDHLAAGDAVCFEGRFGSGGGIR